MPSPSEPPSPASAASPPPHGARAFWVRLRERHLLSVITAAAVLVYYWWKWRTLAAFVTAIDYYEQFMQDFVGHYHPMARQVFADPTPVPGYLYTSFFAVLLAPIGRLDLPAAMWVWGSVQALSVIALCMASARLLRLPPLATAGIVFLLLTSMPVLSNVKWGQVSVLVTACVLGACAMQHRGRSVLAGVLLGFATAIKIYPAAFAFYLLLRRDWRAFAAFVGATLLCYVLVPAIAIGFGPWLAFERSVAATASGIDVAANINSQFLANVALRWFYLLCDRQADPAWIRGVTFVGYGIALACTLLAVALHRRRAGARLPIVCLLVALPFVVQTSWPHYFVYLPFCQVALFCHLRAIARDPAVTSRRRLAIMLATLPVMSMLLGSVFCLDVCGDWSKYNGYGVLLVADLLLVMASAGALLLGQRSGVIAPIAAGPIA